MKSNKHPIKTDKKKNSSPAAESTPKFYFHTWWLWWPRVDVLFSRCLSPGPSLTSAVITDSGVTKTKHPWQIIFVEYLFTMNINTKERTTSTDLITLTTWTGGINSWPHFTFIFTPRRIIVNKAATLTLHCPPETGTSAWRCAPSPHLHPVLCLNGQGWEWCQHFNVRLKLLQKVREVTVVF